jgi:hypothetical protein
VLLVLFLVSVVLMILLRWNPIQWFGWVLTAVAVIYLGNICIYGLNYHAGPIAEDIRLNVTDYTLQELEDATVYYRDLANEYAKQISRDGEGSALYPSFEDLSASAGDGFKMTGSDAKVHFGIGTKAAHLQDRYILFQSEQEFLLVHGSRCKKRCFNAFYEPVGKILPLCDVFDRLAFAGCAG